MAANNTNRKKQISYFEPSLGRQVTREVDIPPALLVKSLETGATVQQIADLDELHKMWGHEIVDHLELPLTAHSRVILTSELKKALPDADAQAIIDSLSTSWQPHDDGALKLIGRLLRAVFRGRQKTEEALHSAESVRICNDQLGSQISQVKQDRKDLERDLRKVVEERDKLKRDKDKSSYTKISELEAALTQAINAKAAVEEERDELRKVAQRNVEIALAEYETEVMGKLGSVATEHKERTKEVAKLKQENERLRGERNVLRSQVDLQQENLQKIKKSIRTVKLSHQQKENEMNPNENTTEPVATETVDEAETLRTGDEVFYKGSGDGPFVLVTQVEEGIVKYQNPIPGKKNHFNCGEVPISDPWLVRDPKTGTMSVVPAPILTKTAPKRTFSFGGLRRVITADVTTKLFTAAIWVTMLTLLYLQRG